MIAAFRSIGAMKSVTGAATATRMQFREFLPLVAETAVLAIAVRETSSALLPGQKQKRL